MHIFNGFDLLLVGAVVVLAFFAHYCFAKAEQARRRLRRTRCDYEQGDVTRAAQEVRRAQAPLNRRTAHDDMASVA